MLPVDRRAWRARDRDSKLQGKLSLGSGLSSSRRFIMCDNTLPSTITDSSNPVPVNLVFSTYLL